jgi:DNA helicase-2/ATP-dependent DNA helicase PcrA
MAAAAWEDVLSKLNPQQREAAVHGRGPLLIVAGAGTGKTTTLAHRVAHFIATGTTPGRILLLTFTRRASAEMLRRVDGILREMHRRSGPPVAHVARIRESEIESPDAGSVSHAVAEAASIHELETESPDAGSVSPELRGPGSRVWGGTFHSVGTRLLRQYGRHIGLPNDFTILDRGDAEDLMQVLRQELKLGQEERDDSERPTRRKTSRFPLKGTCLSIYSRTVNTQAPLRKVLQESFPWCLEHEEKLKELFTAYMDRKEEHAVLDYDDLLIFWQALMQNATAAAAVRRKFDCVLVDEYQDTNVIQANILKGLAPDGEGLTVVGDDAQSIYSFRAATVRNILDFPEQFPGTTVVKLEHNYRSTQPILEATNRVIAEWKERHRKELFSTRETGELPQLVHCADEDEQTEFIVNRALEHRERGTPLHEQAVLFRASHHSIALEVELARRNVPFHKYGGLKFVETAHVKDLLGFLRLAENPRDIVSGLRILVLIPGIGPTRARQLLTQLAQGRYDFRVWKEFKAPKAAKLDWPVFVALMIGLGDPAAKKQKVPDQLHRVRRFYAPLMDGRYDNLDSRLRDLETLEVVSGRFQDRAQFLTEMTLDPPVSTQDLAGDPVLDEDYLVLSTIHSAKGLEWDCVTVIHAADGNIPSDMATESPGQIEEERRLFYVALTRAKDHLYVTVPQRYYFGRFSGDGHSYAQPSRFLTPKARQCFREVVAFPHAATSQDQAEPPQHDTRHVRDGIRRGW